MRFATQLVLLFLPLYGFSQDMLFYDTLIKSRSGDFVKVKSVSELTGLVGTYSLQKGTWHYYGNEGNLLKEAQYKVNAKNRTSFLDGLVQYYDESGTRVLTQTFDNGQLETSIGFKHVILIEGITQIEIKKEYGDFVVVQHRDRFRESKIQTSYANLRGVDELAYYLPEEERLKSLHLLDTALFWPNDERNLVANAMFEIHPTLINSMPSITTEVESWSPASPTPDFYYSEDCKSGTGCIGFRVYSLVKDIEYVQNRLQKPLKKDSLYCFSTYVRLANQCAYTSNGLGVKFSKKPLKNINEALSSSPQLLINESYLPYKSKWMLLQCKYKATGGEKYLTIGSFKPLNEIALTQVKGYSAEAYYIMDDVTLVPIKDSSVCGCNLDDLPANNIVYDTATKETIVASIDTLKVGDRFVLENVYFDIDKHDLLPASIESLRKLLDVMKRYPELKIEIGGHTSSLGGYDHNVLLSQNRAKSVKRFLIVQGVDHLRVKTEGYGPDKPIDTNDNAAGRSKNRRFEVKVLRR